MNHPLPFERGTTQSAPGLEGLKVYDEDRQQHLMIVKNTYSAALTKRLVAKWEDPEKYEVDLAITLADGIKVAGVVDPELSATVPVNRHFYVVQKGIATVVVGSTPIAVVTGSLLVVEGSAASQGKVIACTSAISLTAATAAADAADLKNWVINAFAISQGATAATTADVAIQALIDVRGA